MRKGQITSYIILGLLVLIGFVIVFYTFEQERELDIRPILYPDEIQPLAEFVTSCIQTRGADGIDLALSQGGFVEIPPFIRAESSAHLTLDDYGMRIVPYWTIPGEERIPPLDLTRAQLNTYVTQNALDCIDDFKAMTEEYEVLPLGEMSTDTVIANTQVVFQNTYPLKVIYKPTGQEFLVENYVAFVPVRLKKMHEVASKVMQFENKHHVIENATMSMIVADPDIPTNGMLIDCGGKSWRLTEIRDKLQQSMTLGLQTVRFKNTAHAPFEMDESVYEDLRDAKVGMTKDLEDGLLELKQSRHYPQYTPPDAWSYFNTYYDAGIDRTEMSVAVDYQPRYGMMIDGQPNRNGHMSTKLMKGASKFLQYVCVNTYHFTYDIQYPVKIGVFDPVSNFGRGAVLQFAFPVMIDDNLPTRESLTRTHFPVLEPEVDYCGARGNTVVDLRATGYTLEGLPPTELRNVSFESVCVNKVCKLGYSTADDGVYRLRTTLPRCVNPTIRANKEGYVTAEGVMQDQQLTLGMTKLRPMQVKVKKYRYHEDTGVLQDAGEMIAADQVSIHLSNDDGLLSEYLLYPEQDSINIVDDTERYQLRMILNSNGLTAGGYLNENLSVSFRDISGTDTITFNVVEYAPRPTTEELQGDMAVYLGTGNYVEQLRPTFR